RESPQPKRPYPSTGPVGEGRRGSSAFLLFPAGLAHGDGEGSRGVRERRLDWRLTLALTLPRVLLLGGAGAVVPSYPEAVKNEKEKKRRKGLNVQKQVRDAQRVRPCEELACLERQYEEVRAMKEK
ncbi:hypothetical protein B0H14DRAFT_2573196, partial [Mycena olivaceomarginata]